MSWGGEQQTEVARTCYENGYLPPTGSSDHKFSSTNVLLVPQYTSVVTWCLVTTVNLACGGYVNTDKLTTWTRTVPTLYFTLKLVQWSLTAKVVTKVTTPKGGGALCSTISSREGMCPGAPFPPSSAAYVDEHITINTNRRKVWEHSWTGPFCYQENLDNGLSSKLYPATARKAAQG